MCSEADRLRRWTRKRGPLSRSNGRSSQLGQLLLELGIVTARDVLDQEPFVLAEDEFVHIEEADGGLFIDDGEGRSQGLLAGDDAPNRPPEGVDVQLRADRRGPGIGRRRRSA